MARLSPVPDRPPRALGMVRVSKERDGMISPEVQRASIEDYCRTRGYEIHGWLEGIDESGSRRKSAWWPRLEEAVTKVEDGSYDVIVVWKYSRTARHRLRWAVALDRVETAGGRIESATEQLDANTSIGRFTRGMLAELNVFEAERIGEVWKEVHQSRLAKGVTPTGLPKYGYAWSKADQMHQVDPVTGPIVTELYERYVSGETFRSLALWVNRIGVRTHAGNAWAPNTVSRLLDAGFSAGFIPWKGQLHPGNHEPLISAGLWQQYLDARSERRTVHPRSKTSQFLLSGLVRCGLCGSNMVGQVQAGKYASFRCSAARFKGPTECAGTNVTMVHVEDKIKEWLTALAAKLDDVTPAEEMVTGRRLSAEAETRRLAAQLQTLEKTMQTLTRQVAEGLVLERDYVAARDGFEADYQAVSGRLEEQARLSRQAVSDPSLVAAKLLADWFELPVEVRRTTIGTLVHSIRVTANGHERVEGPKVWRSLASVEVRTTWSEEYVRL